MLTMSGWRSNVPLSQTIMPGLPRRPISAESSRATRAPEKDVSGIAAKHSRVTSSTILKIRKRRPFANWSCAKSRLQRAFARGAIRIGALFPTRARGGGETADLCRRHDYNHHRPHSKLGWLTPTGYAARWQQNEELEGRSSGAFNDDRIQVAPG